MHIHTVHLSVFRPTSFYKLTFLYNSRQSPYLSSLVTRTPITTAPWLYVAEPSFSVITKPIPISTVQYNSLKPTHLCIPPPSPSLVTKPSLQKEPSLPKLPQAVNSSCIKLVFQTTGPQPPVPSRGAVLPPAPHQRHAGVTGPGRVVWSRHFQHILLESRWRIMAGVRGCVRGVVLEASSLGFWLARSSSSMQECGDVGGCG